MPQSEPSGCLPAIFRIFGIGRGAGAPSGTTKPLPYKRKDWLFSKAERSFFGVLQQAVGQEYLIFAYVRVADVLEVAKGTQGWQSYMNKIDRKHIDFLLCDRVNVRPLVAIELDDSSHGTEKRQARDAFMEEAFKAARLPLLRVPCKAGYVPNELASLIRNTIAAGK